MWNKLFEDKQNIARNDIASLIGYLLDMPPNECEHYQSWILLWEDIELIIQSEVIDDFNRVVELFTQWYDGDAIICSIESLQKLQRMRLKLLKISQGNQSNESAIK